MVKKQGDIPSVSYRVSTTMYMWPFAAPTKSRWLREGATCVVDGRHYVAVAAGPHGWLIMPCAVVRVRPSVRVRERFLCASVCATRRPTSIWRIYIGRGSTSEEINY